MLGGDDSRMNLRTAISSATVCLVLGLGACEKASTGPTGPGATTRERMTPATQPRMTTTQPTRQGFFEEVLFAEATARTWRFHDYNNPPSYHVDKMDVYRQLPQAAQAKGLRLLGLVIVGPSGPLWTYWVFVFVKEDQQVRVNQIVMPHARITWKGTGVVTMAQVRAFMGHVGKATFLRRGTFSDEWASDVVVADWSGPEARLFHGKLLAADEAARKSFLDSLEELQQGMKPTYERPG
jgi:hypothetical protein